MTLKIRGSLYITHHFPHQPPLHALRKTRRAHRPPTARGCIEMVKVGRATLRILGTRLLRVGVEQFKLTRTLRILMGEEVLDHSA